MKSIIIIAISVTLLIGFYPAFAESESQTIQTDKGTLEVKLSYDEIISGQLTTLKTDFINPQTQRIQEHIDWKFSVSKDGQTIWGPTQLSHTSTGSLNNLKYEFGEDGLYTLEFQVEGILFQPIPAEVATFENRVGEWIETQIDPPSLQLDAGPNDPAQIVPEWIKNNARWWVDGLIDDQTFVSGIQFLIQEKILNVSTIPNTSPNSDSQVPEWIKNNADWWSQGLITENDFLKGIEYLVQNGIIDVSEKNQYEPLPREWQISGPFSIDRKQYALGEKIFLRIEGLQPHEKGELVVMRPLDAIQYSTYLSIPFDGAQKDGFNYYIEPQLSKTRGLCSIDDVLGEWAIVPTGTIYPILKFDIIEKQVPGTDWDPVC